MQAVATALRERVASAEPWLRAIPEADAAFKPAPEKWSRKEILGHLIDSAVNNHQRFVRAQLAEQLEFPEYDGDGWVAVQGYRERPWRALVELWAAVNLHVAHVIAGIPAQRLGTPCHIGEALPVTLEFVARDYVKHLRHHLQQVLDPEQAAGKTHPPFPQGS